LLDANVKKPNPLQVHRAEGQRADLKRLVEEPICVDGIAGVFNLGVNFGTMLFRWVPVRSDGGGLTYERSPTLVLVQPRTSLLCGKSCRVNTILDAQGLPTASSSHAAGSQSFN
jgi:hypothetical protein